jgi:hypothetical protein
MVWGGGGVAGLWPNFFFSGLIFLAGLAQESWRDLAALMKINKLEAHCTYTRAVPEVMQDRLQVGGGLT